MLSGFRTTTYRSERINDYKARMKNPREGGYEDKIMASVLKQQGYSWGKDNMSYYDPQELYDGLARFAPEHSVDVDVTTPSMKRAIAATFKVFAKPKHMQTLKVLSTPDELYNAIKAEKAAGLPSMGKKEDDFWYAINRRRQVLSDLKVPAPCIAYVRTQLGKKIRLVWGYPHEMTLIEAGFAKPLIDTFLGRNTPMASGISKFELGGRIAGIDNRYGETLGLDFSKFDSTIPRALIYKAFSILETWFDKEDRDEFGWDMLIKYFVNTPIVMPNGKKYSGKRHGVPSGSFFTQLIDSVVNCIIQFWLANELGYSLGSRNFLVLGDDVLISIPREVTLETISSKVSELGMIINPEKTERGAHFLGADWTKGIPYRKLDDILKRMHYIETPIRQYPSKEYVDRKYLAYGLMMQYASSYANVFDMIVRLFPTNDVGRIDELPIVFNDMYEVPEWEAAYTPGSAQFIGLSNKKGIKLLSARLMA